MRSHEIENWALQIVDRVKAGQPNEDSRVELKAEWIDPIKAARRIAGHANAARGELILWIIGVDEKKGVVVGAENLELANWYPSVKSNFDEGMAPALIANLNIPVEGVTVVALLFETDRAPFVVKNSEGGKITREVPWREGTSLRSATRSDLIRLLSPIQKLPGCEVLKGELIAQSRTICSPPPTQSVLEELEEDFVLCEWLLQLIMYISPRNEARLTIPFHKLQASFRIENFIRHQWKWLILTPPGGWDFRLDIPTYESFTIRCTGSEALIEGPGQLNLSGREVIPTPKSVFNQDYSAEIVANLRFTDVDHSVKITELLLPSEPKNQELGIWKFEASRMGKAKCAH